MLDRYFCDLASEGPDIIMHQLINGADTAYNCKHSACLHTQNCAHNVSTEISLVSQKWINYILVPS